MRRWALALLLMAGSAAAAEVPRRLILFADQRDDPALAAQRAVVGQARDGFAARDIRVAERIGGRGAERRRLGVPPRGFGLVLVGRDGGVKLRSVRVVAADRLLGTVDAMPMRRRELREAPMDGVPPAR